MIFSLLLLTVLSLGCNGAVWIMLRDARLPEHLPFPAPAIVADVPLITTDWRGMV